MAFTRKYQVASTSGARGAAAEEKDLSPGWSYRALLEGILYQLKKGCNWEDLPKDLPTYVPTSVIDPLLHPATSQTGLGYLGRSLSTTTQGV